MSVLNQSGEEQVECPLCMEPLEVDDLHFYPCTCGYQICRFCWNRIREGDNGLCPACRKAYPENPADFTPLSQEQVAAIKTEKKAREQKRRNKTLESRRALANVRVVQNNLVFVVGLPVRLADPEILKRQEYFGKYGKIHKVVINQSTTYAGSQGPSASAYVTYVTSADALRAIQGVNNVTLDGRVLKGSLGTTKYCANFMKNQPCPKPDCMYLHELGDPKASFTKEEMHAGLHQVYERKLHNALLAGSQRTDDKQPSTTGNTSTNAEKGSSKDGNQSNFIPTTVVTSSHINVVNSSRSKKESMNGGGSSGSSSSSGSAKDAWPSLGSSPPADTPPKQASPKPQPSVQSQENGTSEPSSPTQQQNHTATNKNGKDTHTDSGKSRHKDNTKKNKNTDKTKRNSATNSNNTDTDEVPIDKEAPQISSSSVFENEQQTFLTSELDELESDRHSLLENHDLLDNSDHSLLEDDTHSLLNHINNEALMMQRHREMLNLVDSNLMKPMVNGYGLMERDMYSERQSSELALRARSRSELLMRHGELLARQHAPHAPHAQHAQHALDHKHYAAAQTIGMDSASDLLGANYHPNHNMLPFGMRVDNSIAGSSLSSNQLSNMNPLSNTMPVNSLSASALGSNPMGSNPMGSNPMGSNPMGMAHMSPMAPFMQQQQMLQQNVQHQAMQHGLMNGYDGSQNNTEGRYLAENMDKFFTDFHKAQQMRQMLLGRGEERPERHAPPYPRHMLSAQRLELQQTRMSSGQQQQQQPAGARACGDADDDLDFDPFKETQKALAEMMETELMQNTSGDNMDRVRRSRLPPPGFGHVSAFPPRPAHHQQDWTAMDPAIMSTSVSKPPQQHASQQGLSQQQQQLFARFNQLGVNGTKVMGGAGAGANTMSGANAGSGAGWAPSAHKLWGSTRVPLPPGFAPQPPAPHHPPECIDAK